MLRRLTRAVCVLALLCCVPLSVGCGGSGLYGLSGSVTYQGSPVQEGTIQLYATGPESSPQTGTPQAGAMIRAGVFQIPAEHGVAPGRYLVKISSSERINNEGDAMNPFFTRERIPSKYNAQTTLTVEVLEGDARTVNFDLD